jgi:hypothetical protein
MESSSDRDYILTLNPARNSRKRAGNPNPREAICFQIKTAPISRGRLVYFDRANFYFFLAAFFLAGAFFLVAFFID